MKMVVKSVKVVEKVNVDDQTASENLEFTEEEVEQIQEFTEEQKKQLDEEFLQSNLYRDMESHYLRQRRMKKFRNPMAHLTPKKKKRK